jgi:hypothetical protein
MSMDDAKEYCGKGARPEGGGCMPIECANGEPVDLASGDCVPLLSLRKLMAATMKPDAALGCLNADAGIIAEGTSVGCLEHSNLCGRGARWRDGCHADPVCPVGTIADPVGACVAVVRKLGPETIVDVGAWLRVVVGPDGGDGTSAVCGPLIERPWRAGVSSHGSAEVDVQVDLLFPDNDVKRAEVTVSAAKHDDPRTVDPGASVPAARYMDPLWSALRRLGGTANAASATVRVRCAVDGGTDLAGTPPTPPAAKDEHPKGRHTRH